jgi:hypothetical protein
LKEEDIITLVKYRLEQAQTALDDAEFLLEGKRSTQSIVNRAYYAMFYAALALLQRIGKIPSKHTGVISLFDREFVLKGIFSKDLSKDFHKAFELRQVSDYKTYETISWENAKELLDKSSNFVKSIKEYLEDIISDKNQA